MSRVFWLRLRHPIFYLWLVRHFYRERRERERQQRENRR